jgi:serine/threonine protein kinase/Tfp pilus assembly protein PilF
MWDLFHHAVELPLEERDRWLDGRCSDDPSLRRELAELLQEHDDPSGRLDRPDVLSGTEQRPGDRVGPYRIERLLGEGGMGVVYRATQTDPVRRTVALKLIRPGMDTREVISRFQLERQTLALLEHPNIAHVHDAGTTPDGRPYFAMELVEGMPITEYCDAHRLDLEQRLDLFDRVCSGVQHAHQRGIIHRDIKPSNVQVAMIDGEPVPKIIDFGIARATQQAQVGQSVFTELGRMVGTPEYMSPEQAGLTDDTVDTRTDVYALGVLLYELLTGTQPFDWQRLRKAGYDEIRRIIRDDDPPRPSTQVGRAPVDASAATDRGTDVMGLTRTLSGDLDWIVLKALEKDRNRRYDSPSGLAADLARYRDHRPIEARPPSAAYRLGKFTRRHRVAVTAAVVVVVAIVAGVAIGAAGFVRAVESSREARREAATATAVSEFLIDLLSSSRPSDREANTLLVREVLDTGAQTIRESLSDQPGIRSRVLVTLGEAYRSLGLYEEARPLLEEAVRLQNELVGEESPQAAMTLSSLAFLEIEAGRLGPAREMLETTVRRLRAAHGDGHADTLFAMDNLGQLYARLGLHAEAREIYESLIETRTRMLEPDDPTLGQTYWSLAVACAEDGDYDVAEEHLGRALSISEIHEGPGSPSLQYMVNSLAIVYWNRGEYERARPLFERAYESIRRTHGEEHPYTASMMNNLGLLLIELEDYDRARPLTEGALDLRRKLLEPDHPDVATSLLNLARLMAATGEPGPALEHFRQGLAARARALGEEHPSLVAPLRSYARLLRRNGRESEAASIDRRADTIEARGEGS